MVSAFQSWDFLHTTEIISLVPSLSALAQIYLGESPVYLVLAYSSKHPRMLMKLLDESAILKTIHVFHHLTSKNIIRRVKRVKVISSKNIIAANRSCNNSSVIVLPTRPSSVSQALQAKQTRAELIHM
jgi:hypothetical protein